MTTHHVNTTDFNAGPFPRDETESEYINDFVLGVAFVCVGVASAQRYVIFVICIVFT